MSETKNQDFLRESALLGFADLARNAIVDKKSAHNLYPVHSFGRMFSSKNSDLFKTYIPHLSHELKSAVKEGKSPKIQTLIVALGKIAHPKILAAFEPYLEEKEPASKHQRLLMVLSMHDLTDTYPKVARSVAYKIYANSGESHEIRCAAVRVLMKTNPPASMLQRMAETTNYDDSRHVSSAVKSAIESASELESSQDRELRNNARAARGLLSKERFGPQYSRNIVKDLLDNELKVKMQASYIGGKDSIIPKELFLSLKHSYRSLKMPTSKVGAMVSSIEDLLDNLEDELTDDDSESNFRQDRNSNNGNSNFSAEKITRTLKIEADGATQLEGFAALDTAFASQFVAFDNHTVERIPKWLKQASESLRESHHFNLNKFNTDERILSFPTETGFPFTYSWRMPTLVKLEGKAKLKTERGSSDKNLPKKVDASSEMRIVYSVKIQERIGFLTPFEHKHYMAGEDKNFQIYLPIRLEAEVDTEMKEVKVKVQSVEKKDSFKALQASNVPYTSSHDILSMKPVFQDSTNTRVMRNEETKKQTISPRFLSAVEIELEREENEGEKTNNRQHPLPSIISRIYDASTNSGFKKMNVKVDSDNSDQAIKFTLSYDSKHKFQSDNDQSDRSRESNDRSNSRHKSHSNRDDNDRSRDNNDRSRDNNDRSRDNNDRSRDKNDRSRDKNDRSRDNNDRENSKHNSNSNSNRDDNDRFDESNDRSNRAKAPRPSDKGGNSESRKNQFLHDASKGIESARSSVVDMSVEVTGKRSAQFALTAAMATSNVDESSRGLFYASGQGEKVDYEVCAALEANSPNSPEIDYKEVLNADLTEEFDADIRYGRDCSSGAKIRVEGKRKQSKEYEKEVRESDAAKEIESMLKGEEQTTSRAYQDLMRRASELDETEVTLDFSDKAEGAKEASMKLLEMVADNMNNVAEINTVNPQNADKNRIDFKLKTTWKNGAFVTVNAPNMDVKMKNVFPENMLDDSDDNLQTSKSSEEDDVESLAETEDSCFMDRKVVETFDNEAIPYELGKCWHVIMTTFPKEDADRPNKDRPIPSDMDATILAREVENEQKEVNIVLGNKEIRLKKPSSQVEVTVDGHKISVSKRRSFEKKSNERDFDGNRKSQFEIFELDDGSVKVTSESHGVDVVFSGRRMKITAADKYRNSVRGICGNYDGESFNDKKTPKNCEVRNPKEFAASWALTQERCEGPALKYAESAQRAHCARDDDRPSNVINDEEAGRARGSSPSNWGHHNRDSNKSSRCTTYRTKVTKADSETCFSLRPLPSCSGDCRPNNTKEKTIDMHCVKDSSAAEKLAERVYKGANPDLSQKSVSRTMKMDVPISCRAG